MDNKTIITGLIQTDNAGEQVRRGSLIVDNRTGLIEDIIFGEALTQESERHYAYDDSYIIKAGDINAHAHPEQSIYTDMADKSWDLSTWCRNTIYKYSPALQPEHIYYACCRAFSRMLSLGVTSVFVSFYCHNNQGNTYDKEVIRAAEATGIRLYFGRMNYDIITEGAYEAKQKSQKCYFETADEAAENFKALLKDISLPNVVIAPAIHSIHASTKEAIISGINLANQYDRYIQFHLSEDSGDVALSQSWYGMRPIAFLESLMLEKQVESLEKLLLSDCIWIDDNERALIKKYNMKVVLNPRMNNQIKAGQADLPKLLSEGIQLYLGTDGEASNDDLSIEGERAYLEKQYKDIPKSIVEAMGFTDLKFKEGYIGKISIGNYCDLKVMQNNRLTDVFVGGRKVIENNKHRLIDVEKDIEQPLKMKIADL